MVIDLKSIVVQATRGSNPLLSAMKIQCRSKTGIFHTPRRRTKRQKTLRKILMTGREKYCIIQTVNYKTPKEEDP